MMRMLEFYVRVIVVPASNESTLLEIENYS